MGFSVTGRVLNGPEGEGVPEAVVTLNNQIKGGQARDPGGCVPLWVLIMERNGKETKPQ